MSLPDPVLPIRVDPVVKRTVEALAAREKVAAGTYARQKLELALLRSIVKHQWRQLGFEGVLQRLCPELLAEDGTPEAGDGRATNAHTRAHQQ